MSRGASQESSRRSAVAGRRAAKANPESADCPVMTESPNIEPHEPQQRADTMKPEASPDTAAEDPIARLEALTLKRPVPVLPRGTTELFVALGDPALSFDVLTERLAVFPSIVARLLALANSPWSSPVAPVATLDDAVSRLGLDIVRSVAVALLVSNTFDANRCRRFDPRLYWCSALLSAECASLLAASARPAAPLSTPLPPATARTAGLINNLGLLWLADALPAETDDALEAVAADPALSVSAALISVCGVSDGDAGEALGKAWNLPAALTAAMSGRAAPGACHEVLYCVRLIRCVHAIVASALDDSALAVDDILLQQLGLNVTGTETIRAELVAMLPELNQLAAELLEGT